VIRTSTLTIALVLTLFASPAVLAQAPDDAVLNPVEPDFGLVSLPTSLRLPPLGSAFRFMHRFSLPLNTTGFGDAASQLFGIDSAAIVGLEYRIGLAKNFQAGIHHSSDNRTWAFFGQYGIVRQTTAFPFDISAIGSVDLIREPVFAGGVSTGTFERNSAPSIGAIVSTTFGGHVAVYGEPIYVHNVFNEFALAAPRGNATLLGLGARVRLLPKLYVVGEAAPRVAGAMPNRTHVGFGLEARAGGHMFQLNVSNSFDTTLSQLAMGADPSNNWHLGFNITRKFF
jgi:Membrane bound beta barrel domain (DUF5777)